MCPDPPPWVEPVINKEPLIWNWEPEANIKFLLFALEVPFPIIKADWAELVMLYWPCTCW